MAQSQFTDQTEAAGIKHRHTFGGLEKKYILEAHGSGAAFFDGDNDGDLDLYVVNGSTFETYQDKSGPGNFLYRNNIFILCSRHIIFFLRPFRFVSCV